MRKIFKKAAAVFTLSAMLALSAADAARVMASDRDTAMANDPDPFTPKQAQAYDTKNLTLTKGLTYIQNGKEIEVTGAIDTMVFCADPTCIEAEDGRIYMYATLDQRSYAKSFNGNGGAINPSNNPLDGMVIGNIYQTKKLAIYSTADLVNWTDEGVIDMDKVPSAGGGFAGSRWAWNSWAPSALRYDSDGDGKDEYYIFFTNGGNIGYVKGESPTGPWKDELGQLLIDKSKIPNGMGNNIIWNFDPSVLMDDDGNAYIYWGGGNLPGEAAKHPKTSRACRMKILPNRIEMDWSTLTQLDAYYMFEDNEINKFQGKYVYSYCANWNVPRDNKYIKDGAAVSIIAYVSDDPLHVTSDPENYKSGQPKYLGAILKNPGEQLFHEWYNNHHHMFEFKGKYYILYHTTALDQFLYKDFYQAAGRQSLSYRNMHIDEIKVDVKGNNPSIQIQPTYAGPGQVQNFNPYQVINATTQSHQGGLTRSILADGTTVLDKIDTGDWTRIDQVDFGSGGAGSLKASISSTNAKGSIEVYLDEALTGTKIATLPLRQTVSGKYETISTALNSVTGVHDVYFVFRGSGYQVASWEFVPASASAVTPAKPAIQSLTSLKGNRVRVTLKKAVKNADGYEIRYSLTSDMKNARTVTVTGAAKKKIVIEKLDSRKTYYVQVRSYKSVDGELSYSKWSGKKKITCS